MTYQILAAVSFLLILIPLSVDNYWSLSWHDYHLRVTYAGALLGFLSALIFAATHPALRTKLRSAGSRSALWAWAALALTGLAGTLINSVSPFRSLCFLAWATGTLAGVPLLVAYFETQLGRKTLYALWAYGLVQSAVILLDAGICIPTGGLWHIGRVMVYQSSEQGNLCRPHAWYQEPGYFAAFMLLVLISAREGTRREAGLLSRRLAGVTYVLGMLATIATTSRLGWIGAGALLLFDLRDAVRAGDQGKQESRKIAWKWAAAPILAMAVLLGVAWKPIYNHAARGLVSPTRDPSFIYRAWRLKAGWSVFRTNPVFGAGPGGAGAYYVDRSPEDDFKRTRPPNELSYMRHDPLSQNLYTELLSEWGILGFLAFIAYLYLGFLKRLRPSVSLRTGLILALIYLSTQTLARFDLWWALASMSCFWGRKNGDG